MVHFPQHQPLSLHHPLSLRNIASDLRRADNFAILIPDGGNRQRNVEERSILMLPYRLEMFDPPAIANVIDNCIFFMQAIVRDDDTDVPPHRLGGGKSEKSLGASVPAGNNAVDGLTDDRIVGIFDDGGEPGFGRQAGNPKMFRDRVIDQ
nr:hypothetical protein [Rhizobium sp. BK312]